ncbi:MAG: hypothetical protein JW779_14015 [Candidatus Thorarchaeota archaeon]|nr:hypothetical protein [Candidatus Thorarchaeota archaeon]
MEESLYDIAIRWANKEWILESAYDLVTAINTSIQEIGHGESGLGVALNRLWTFLDQMMFSFGLIMTDDEMQTELTSLLDHDEMLVLKEVKVKQNHDEVTITNLEELRKTGDPEAVKRHNLRKSFDDLIGKHGPKGI